MPVPQVTVTYPIVHLDLQPTTLGGTIWNASGPHSMDPQRRHNPAALRDAAYRPYLMLAPRRSPIGFTTVCHADNEHDRALNPIHDPVVCDAKAIVPWGHADQHLDPSTGSRIWCLAQDRRGPKELQPDCRGNALEIAHGGRSKLNVEGAQARVPSALRARRASRSPCVWPPARSAPSS